MDATKAVASNRAEQPGSSADVRLAAAVLRKDRKAAAELVNRYSDPVYAYLRRRLVPRVDLADDLLQEVFLAAWENLAAFRGHSSLRAWLLGIARHKVEDHYRRLLREPDSLTEENSESPSGPTSVPLFDEWMDRERLEEKTRQVLQSLPDHYSAALLWRYWERRSVAEMAQRTGRTDKAIERLLARARQQFRRRWTGE